MAPGPPEGKPQQEEQLRVGAVSITPAEDQAIEYLIAVLANTSERVSCVAKFRER